MKFKELIEAIESGGSIPNNERQISGLTNKPEYAMETNPYKVPQEDTEKLSTDLFPFEIDNIKNQLDDIRKKTFQLKAQCEASLNNPSIKKKPSKKVSIRGIMSELDKIDKKLSITIPKHLKHF